MLRKILFPVLLGLAGVGTLCGLGSWQLDRLAWKEGILAEIGARLAAAPMPLPETPTEEADEYTRVRLTGTPDANELHVLTSGTEGGTGYRVIRAVETEQGRRILLDAGLLALDAKSQTHDAPMTQITGTLVWPDDMNSSTPDPDLSQNIWFGRDVLAMSETLNAEPVMVIASMMSPPDPRLTLLPVDRAGIKNDHLEYAITWFGLALVWAIMSIFLIFRTLRTKDN